MILLRIKTQYIKYYIKLVTVFICIINCGRFVYAQEKNIETNDTIELHNRAVECERKGNNKQALKYFERIDYLLCKNRNKNWDAIQDNMICMSLEYQRLGKWEEALNILVKSLNISIKEGGYNYWKTARDYAKISDLYISKSEYPEAIEFANKAIEIAKKLPESKNDKLIVSGYLSLIAKIYGEMGDKSRAKDIYNQILKEYEKTYNQKLKKEYRDETDELDMHAYPTTLQCLAALCSEDDPDIAIKLCKKGIILDKKIKVLSQEDTYFPYLYTMGHAYFISKDYTKSKECYEELYSKSKKMYGDKSLQIVKNADDLAEIYRVLGNYKEALNLTSDIVNICKNNATDPGYGIYYRLAIDNYLNGNKTESAEFLIKYLEELNKNLESILQLGEKLKLSWVKKHINLWLPFKILDAEKNSQIILKWKGSVLESLLQNKALNRREKNKSDLYEQAKNIKTEIERLKISRNQVTKDKIIDLELKLDEVESRISNNYKSNQKIFNVDALSLKESLRKDEIFINLILCKNPIDSAEEYGAIVFSNSGSTKSFVLNEALLINSAISGYKKALLTGDENMLKEQMGILLQKLWKPIADTLPPDTKRIYISSDGPINFVSFASLQDYQGRFLSEKYQIAYVGTGRDLLRPYKPTDRKNIVIYANPDFAFQYSSKGSSDTNATSSYNMKPEELAEFTKVQLPQLPGTEQEATTVAQIAKDAHLFDESHLGVEANKKGLMAIQAPAILHLATHGFFLGGEESAGVGDRGMKVIAALVPDEPSSAPNAETMKISPMRQSGLALTGGQSTLQAWGRGEFPDPSNDGILSAEDVATLDLEATWLVTLSACETGVGRVQSGEGVFGLSRAFMIAGAQNLLMTLWPVSDETTPKIMADFYREALATHDAAGSLAKIQRDWLVKLRKEKGLLAAVRDAGPFAMVVMANPNAKPLPEMPPQTSPVPAPTGAPASTKPPDDTSAGQPVVSGSTIEIESRQDPSSISPSATPVSTAGVQSGNARVLEFDEALSRADAGDAYAQGVVSIYYGLGYKTPKDVARAASYALKSAAQENPLGIYRVGAMRSEGEGMPRNSDQGRTLKRKAFDGLNAMTGDPYALNILGIMTYSGEIVQQDAVEALRLYKKSADLGYSPAQYNYANLVLDGGVPGDTEEATTYKEKAAAQNYP